MYVNSDVSLAIITTNMNLFLILTLLEYSLARKFYSLYKYGFLKASSRLNALKNKPN